jgi:hypothetical protein
VEGDGDEEVANFTLVRTVFTSVVMHHPSVSCGYGFGRRHDRER